MRVEGHLNLRRREGRTKLNKPHIYNLNHTSNYFSFRPLCVAQLPPKGGVKKKNMKKKDNKRRINIELMPEW
jgi:hypothetical protein